jgi:hypothetical protein
MKTSSAKSKGRNLQKKVVAGILKHHNQLSPNDVRSTSMGATGRDILLSDAALKSFPYAVECKSYARVAVYSWFDQCIANAGNDTPLLVIKQNHSEPLAVVTLEHFLELTKSKS